MTSYRELAEQVDVASIEAAAQDNWIAAKKRREGINQRIARGIPVAVLIMLVAFFALSFPHTAEIMNMVTPGIGGFAGPVAFELGIILIAAVRASGHRTPITKITMLGLIVMSIIINIGGGISAVVSATGLQAESLNDVIANFGSYPALIQIGLVCAPIAGVAVPVVSAIIGEMLIGFAMNKIKLHGKDYSAEWLEDREAVLRKALYNEAMRIIGPAKADLWSREIARKWYGVSQPVPDVPAVGQPVPLGTTSGTLAPNMGFASMLSEPVPGVPNVGTGGAAQRIVEYFESNPEALYSSARQIAAETGFSKSSVARVQVSLRGRHSNWEQSE